MMSRILWRTNSSGKRSSVLMTLSSPTRMKLSSLPPEPRPSSPIIFRSRMKPKVRAGAISAL